MDEGSAVAWFERDFAPTLIRHLGYARLVRDATLAALRRQLPIH